MVIGGGRRASFSPASLFAAGEVGAWYDPSDLTTLFQDTAGTTPVTTPGQTVALMLDKSRVQSFDGPRRNLQTWTEQFDNPAWSKFNSTVTANATTAPDGTVTADKLFETVVNAAHSTDGGGISISGTLTWSVYAKAAERSFVRLVATQLTPSTIDRLVVVDLSNGAVSSVDPLATASAVSVGNGWYRISLTTTYSSTSLRLTVAIGESATNFAYPGVVGNGIFIWGAQLELGSTATTYQRIDAGPLPAAWLGNHATQATAAQRPTYGIEPMTGRRNLLIRTGELYNPSWQNYFIGQSESTVLAPDGVSNSTVLSGGDMNTRIYQYASGNFPTGNYTFSVWLRANSNVSSRISVMGGGSFLFPTFDNTITVNLTTSWQRLSVTGTNNSVQQIFVTIFNNANTIYAWGAQLEAGSTVTNYQSVTTQFNVTEAGVASKSYLFFDGVDDGMLTGTITPSTDKAQVFAGVRKLNDVGSIVAELSSNAGGNSGSFYLVSGEDLSSRYSSLGAGTVGGTGAVALWTSGGTAIDTSVLAATHDIPGDLSTIRRNGVLGVNATADKGTGNFLAYPLYIGRRAGTSLPFNGNLYGLITRFSATNLDAATITSTETWVNSKTGAY